MPMKLRSFLAAIATTASAFAADGGFLFVTFKGEESPMTEQIYFAVSDEGKRWDGLHGNEPVLVSKLGEKGVRDPFIFRSHDGAKTYMIATDLSIHLNRDWGRAQRAGSKSIVIWESTDLVKWSEPRLVKVAPDDAGCTWAPEAVYDEDAGDYLVFWASKTGGDGYKKQRIWAARTKDFTTFSKPEIYIERPSDIIDTDIVRENGVYYRFSKDETTKAITMESSPKLMGEWKNVEKFSLAGLKGYEGPACFPLKSAAAGGKATWCLMLDQYSKGTGYHAWTTNDISTGEFKPAGDFKFPFRTRHGAVLAITDKEMKALKDSYAKGPRKSARASERD
jgi:sucrose-6-phosphate hydrolase SacC (GH32 family)